MCHYVAELSKCTELYGLPIAIHRRRDWDVAIVRDGNNFRAEVTVPANHWACGKVSDMPVTHPVEFQADSVDAARAQVDKIIAFLKGQKPDNLDTILGAH